MASFAEKELLYFRTAAEWETWLEKHATDSVGVRLQLGKKSAGSPDLMYPEALDVALCFGWIDGQSSGYDETHYLVSFGPRRSRSPWSQINQGHVARLIEAGRMREAGHAEIGRARGDGRWDAAYRQKDAEVPADLRAALDGNPAASAMFEKLSSQNRFAILFRIGNVKLATTRARKIAAFVEDLAAGTTVHPQKSEAPEA